jgi:hypothetical protein
MLGWSGVAIFYMCRGTTRPQSADAIRVRQVQQRCGKQVDARAEGVLCACRQNSCMRLLFFSATHTVDAISQTTGKETQPLGSFSTRCAWAGDAAGVHHKVAHQRIATGALVFGVNLDGRRRCRQACSGQLAVDAMLARCRSPAGY